MSAFIKNIFREISHTKSRFLSIFAIIAIGAGFFTGLKSTCPDMIATIVDYFHENDLMDIRLVSTYGFSDKDIEAIRKTEGVREIYPTYSKDVFVNNEENISIISRIISIPDDSTADYASKEINKPLLMEGRMPESVNECVVDVYNLLEVSFEIGDTISVYTTDPDNPIEDSLNITEWTIVGKIMNPQYINYRHGNTKIGTGILDMYFMVPESSFSYDVYTDVYLTMESTFGFDAFSEEYENAMEIEIDKFEALSEIREPARLNEIKADAKEEITEAKEKIADAKEEISDAEKELADAYKKLVNGEKELSDSKKEYEEALTKFNEEIAKAERKIKSGSKKIKSGWSEVNENEEKISSAEDELNSGLEDMGLTTGDLYTRSGQISGIVKQIEKIPGYEYSQIYQKLKDQQTQLDEAIAGYEEIESAKEQIENAKNELKSGEQKLSDAVATLKNMKLETLSDFAEAEKIIKNAEEELAEGWKEYYDGLEEFEDGKAEAEEKIADAETELAEAEEKLADLKMPVWYVFTREDNPGYGTYEEDAYRVESVTKVFPVFFFMVAMLVCLTTMTRMVEEERTETGIMKALGYGKGAIATKYLVYSSLASLSGSIVGIFLGVRIFPNVIYAAYRMIYITVPLKHVPQTGLWIIVVLISIACTTIAVLMAAITELRSKPAQLMRPKAPKAGKRVLLEKISFIWSKLNFTQKVTVRNIFRYKKRIFMTILGIAGCTALILTGFGIYTSITVILDKQYKELFHYDLVVTLDSNAEEDVLINTDSVIVNNHLISESMPVYMMAVDYENIDSISLGVTEDDDVFKDMITLRDLDTGEPLEFNEEGIVVTKRFSELSGLEAGDEITFTVDEKEITVNIVGVAENYAFHYFFMTNNLYEKLTGERAERNTYFCIMSDQSVEAQNELANELMEDDGILAATFARTSLDSFEDTVSNLKYVVILVIICAALLAIVVLYNLSNINITERVREIATIKVLGFYNKEVSNYVFRENVILSLIGALAGLVVGVYFHQFVMTVAQTNTVMFGKDLPTKNFFFAFFMTMVFTYVVNFIMYFKLKKISMVESLKSIE